MSVRRTMRPGLMTRRLRGLYKALQDEGGEGKDQRIARGGSPMAGRQRKSRREAGLIQVLTLRGDGRSGSLRHSLAADQTAMRSSSSVGSRST